MAVLGRDFAVFSSFSFTPQIGLEIEIEMDPTRGEDHFKTSTLQFYA
jgi:hypothetical protein